MCKIVVYDLNHSLFSTDDDLSLSWNIYDSWYGENDGLKHQVLGVRVPCWISTVDNMGSQIYKFTVKLPYSRT